jgi:hypothetical protein
MKIDTVSFERVEQFKYLGTNLMDQNSVQEEIKKRLKSGNPCHHSVQNLLSSSLLSKSIKICNTQKYNFACFDMDMSYGWGVQCKM